MIWRSSFNSRVAQAADLLTVFGAYYLSYLIWGALYGQVGSMLPRPVEMDSRVVVYMIFSSVIYVILFQIQKAYSFQRFTSLRTEYSVVFRVSTLGVVLSIVVAFFANMTGVRRTFFFLSYVVTLLLLILQKTLLFYVARFSRKKGRNRKRILVVGTGQRTERFIEKVKSRFDWGLDIIGLLTGDPELVGKKYHGVPVIGVYRQINEIIREYNPEEVFVTISTKHFDEIRAVLEACEAVGIQMRLNSDFFGTLAKRVRTDHVMGLSIISFDYNRQSELDLFFKRCIDILVSSFLLIVLLPVFLVISLIIYVQDGRPIFYRWKVMGKNRRPITSWKFRTMVKNADEVKEKLKKNNEMNGPVFKMTNDPRILPFGRFLRRYSLDELPQLFSVLKGDLSLVGPRPPLQSEFKEFNLWHRRKLTVKPGLTCLWQTNGRNEIRNFDEWAKLDLQYIDNWSLWLDFKILLKTIPAVLRGTGK